MQNTYSSEIGYRLLTDSTDTEINEKLRELIISNKPIELVVHFVKNLLRNCLKKFDVAIVQELYEILEKEDPCSHDISKLQQAIRDNQWPSVDLPGTPLPEWKKANESHYMRNPNQLAGKIADDIEWLSTSPQVVFKAVTELAEYLDGYSEDINNQTSNTAFRLVNLASLFANKYDAQSLGELLVAFDKISPHLDEGFVFFSQHILYKELSKKMQDGITGPHVLSVCKALSLTADAYIVKNDESEEGIFDDKIWSPEEVMKYRADSRETRELVNYSLEQLQTFPDVFNNKHLIEIFECLCNFQSGGIDIDPAVAAKLFPVNSMPGKQYNLRVLVWSGYLFEEGLSEPQRENLLKMEKELQRRFEERADEHISVSASERDAQEYLKKNYGHLPLSFNQWLYGFERDCLVQLPFVKDKYINFEIDGYDFHRFKKKRDEIKDCISQKKGVKVVHIEKFPGYRTKKQSVQDTYDVIDTYLRYFKRHY